MKFFIKGFLCCVLFSTSPYIFAQSIVEGVVRTNEGVFLENVQVKILSDSTLSDAKGSFSLLTNQVGEQKVIFTKPDYYSDTVSLDIVSKKVYTIKIRLVKSSTELEAVDVTSRDRMENQTQIDIKTIEAFVGPTGGVEGILRTFAGVSSRNELSSQYSVRGGNFDENLVYVNGIEVYRPFLVRNGQQEGLSFINSDMIQSVDFSAGGFDARYGDKMSSVLDIKYRRPTEFGLRMSAGMLGGAVTIEDVSKNKRFDYLVSVRYRQNSMLLGSMDTEADFQPRFTDIQASLNYSVTDNFTLSYLGNVSRNVYLVQPTSRQTDFGSFQQALRLNVFFDGVEDYDFQTNFHALSAVWKPRKNIRTQISTSVYQSVEQEYFDVIGAYRLSELDNDLGSDNFGEIDFLRGTGGFHNFARNRLDAIVANLDLNTTVVTEKSTWNVGVKWQYEDIRDRYKEWEYIDSTGYSVPHQPEINITRSDDNEIVLVNSPIDGLRMFESFDSRASVFSHRVMGFIENQRKWTWGKREFSYSMGVRAHHWSLNGQTVVSPRATLKAKPFKDSDMIFRVSAGYYHQPAFYREMRDLGGNINRDIRAQQAFHFVLGNDHILNMWDRDFRLVTELYYKDLQNLVTYQMENVRLRYSAQNDAAGYAAGVDFRIHGEFVRGVESWLSISMMTIREKFDAFPELGYLPRPTDQFFNASIFFQDHFPGDDSWKISVTAMYGTGQPFQPPRANPSENIFRISHYRRVDIGVYKIMKKENETAKWDFLNKFKGVTVGLDVFNLLGIRNTISYLWIREINSSNPDVSTSRQYAVPNFLTNRLLNFNIKVQL
ncbi:MAG: TonB-dependent receptor plug domain-containing protein [Cryomorphaceae bacterium]|nr:TonB-dependent receptor plug domain-containing protein [Cryomorphaceae bacterium]